MIGHVGTYYYPMKAHEFMTDYCTDPSKVAVDEEALKS